jgi:hypothetical protein
MFIIQKTTKAGSKYTGDECVTIEEAKAVCAERTAGKVPTTDDAENYFRLEVCEVLPDGNLEVVHATDFFEE